METIKTLYERKEDEEKLALYGNGNYVLSKPYKKWFTHRWHSFSQENKIKYFEKFCTAEPSVESTFNKPVNSGKKANNRVRCRNDAPASIVVDRQFTTPATTPSFVNSSTVTLASSQPVAPVASFSNSQPVASTLSAATSTASTEPTASNPVSAFSSSTDDLEISFDDPRAPAEPMFELHFRTDLSSLVKKCQGNCGRGITAKDRMFLKSAGETTYMKNGKEIIKFGPTYIHFKDDCLKKYDRNTYYAPQEKFEWKRITVNPVAKAKLTSRDVAFLCAMGINP